MISWADYQNSKKRNQEDFFEKRVQTNIECPECKKNLFVRRDIVLTSYPPKHRFECDCGWVGYA